jgi:hypothetical protein
MAKTRIYLSRNSEYKTSLALMFTSDIFLYICSFIIKSSIYAVFHFVSLRDKIFIVFLLMNIYS